MNALQEQWVEALESGEYKQGQRNLCYEDKYCCLGVACEVMGIEGEEMAGFVYFKGNNIVLLEFEKLGLRGMRGELASGPYASLASMNDSGKSFKEIAQFIRDNEGLVFV